jgi:hypothetical protein
MEDTEMDGRTTPKCAPLASDTTTVSIIALLMYFIFSGVFGWTENGVKR